MVHGGIASSQVTKELITAVPVDHKAYKKAHWGDKCDAGADGEEAYSTQSSSEDPT